MKEHIYIAIDLKSFYASVEAVERGLDPLTTNIVVADKRRTEKTICLAVSPSLKAYGIPGRARLFEVVSKMKEINGKRRCNAPGGVFSGSAFDIKELEKSPGYAADYIVAPPRMAYYMECSSRIYNVYLKYVSSEDIHVYSIDEVFMDVTDYLNTYEMTARELAMTIVSDVLNTTKITATAGIGTNLYLSKIAMDIMAKHIEPDENGVRIAELNEMTYRRLLWEHRPITDFWRVGKGYSKKLEEIGIYTMGDVARCSIGKPDEYYNEELLYRLFGINAELLIDHAWGWEPCTIADIKSYKPENNSIGSGQVLQQPYDFNKARLIVHEMADLLSLDLVDKSLVTDQIVLTVGYDIDNLINQEIKNKYNGEITMDGYGRKIPKHAHGTANIGRQTSSSKIIIDTALQLYDKIVNKDLLVRRVNISANHVVDENRVKKKENYEQLNLFTDYQAIKENRDKEEARLNKEKKMQQTVLNIKKKYGKNAILKGINLEEGATTVERNKQIGGHKA